MQWLLLFAGIGVGYLALRAIGNLQRSDSSGGGVSVGIGVGGTGSDSAGIGGDIAGQHDNQQSRLLGGAATGFGVGGFVGALFGAVAGFVSNLIEGPAMSPDVRRWGIPFRPEWTLWDDTAKTATFFVPGPDEIEAVSIVLPYDTLTILFPGCPLSAIKKSGVVSWRPFDDSTPVSALLYSAEVAGGWLPQYEDRHLSNIGDYSPANWAGDETKPERVAWLDFWRAHPRKYSGDADAALTITLVRRLAHFHAHNPNFHLELRKLFGFAGWGRAEWTSDGRAVWTDSENADQKDTPYNFGLPSFYSLANSLKIFVPAWPQGEPITEKDILDMSQGRGPAVEDLAQLMPAPSTHNPTCGVLAVHGNCFEQHDYIPRHQVEEISIYTPSSPQRGFRGLWRLPQ